MYPQIMLGFFYSFIDGSSPYDFTIASRLASRTAAQETFHSLFSADYSYLTLLKLPCFFSSLFLFFFHSVCGNPFEFQSCP